MASVQLRGIFKSFGGPPVLQDLNLTVADGELVVFVGPSGCGKSTILRIVAGLEEQDGGDVLIGAQIVNAQSPAERGVAMVFQSYALYPQMTVYENMAFALEVAKRPKAEIDAAVREAARILSIEPLLERKPRVLSGGQRQRVAIGRAIVRKPQVFLFDEPLSNLDAGLRVRMRYEFAKLHRDLGATMIYVTHDQVEAMTLADRIVVLSQGKIEQIGAPLDLYERPANAFVAGFIGSPRINLLPGVLIATDAAGVGVKLSSGPIIRAAKRAGRLAIGAGVTLGVRPEHLTPGGQNAFQAEVKLVELLGGTTFVYASTPDAADDVVVHLDGGPPRIGEVITLGVDPDKAHVFDPQGLALEPVDAVRPG